MALNQYGISNSLAIYLANHSTFLDLFWVLIILMIITMFLSDIINNAATALIMAPIAVGIAMSMGVSADPFLMSVAVGASCAFLTLLASVILQLQNILQAVPDRLLS